MATRAKVRLSYIFVNKNVEHQNSDLNKVYQAPEIKPLLNLILLLGLMLIQIHTIRSLNFCLSSSLLLYHVVV